MAISDLLEKAGQVEGKPTQEPEEEKFAPLEEVIGPIKERVNSGELELKDAVLQIIGGLTEVIEGQKAKENKQKLETYKIKPSKVEEFSQNLKQKET